MVKTVENFEELKAFVQENEGKTVKLGRNADLFERFSGANEILQGMAEYDVATGEIRGGSRAGRMETVKNMLKENEFLAEVVNDMGENAGKLGKDLEKNKAKLERNFGKLVNDFDRVEAKIVDAGEKLSRDVAKQNETLSKVYREETSKLRDQLRDATSDEARKTVNGKLENLTARFESAREALKEGAEVKREMLGEMRLDMKAVIKEMEGATGLSAESVRGASSWVAKSGTAAETSAKVGENAAKSEGLIAFAKRNKIATAIGAVVAGYAALQLLGGGKSSEPSRA
ncbi:MAG: hypothetical protein CMM93_04470 [Rickettsiales bacterium]|mgnify:CR=1 FL=1|nr:hypothetical protein [Rickettsiales bacterium]|tara:strand:+ start:631 stop:1491 length:861 start_codon:yes stop_codon:yes gene_type:complete